MFTGNGRQIAWTAAERRSQQPQAITRGGCTNVPTLYRGTVIHSNADVWLRCRFAQFM